MKNKNFITLLITLALPISLQSIISASLSIIDQMMIGQLGEQTVASVGLGSRLPFIFMMVLFGITSATSIYASQYFGKGELSKINKVVSGTFTLGIPVSILFMVISIFMPESIIGLFSSDSSVIRGGVPYLQYIALGFIPQLITLTYGSVLRSTHHVKLPLIAGMTSVILNTFLNYLLIFGHLGMPGLGIQGAAIATTISRIIEMIIIIGFVYIKRTPGAIRISHLFTFDRHFLKHFFLTSAPLLINEFLWSVGESIYTGIYGRMGTNQAAGMIITYPLQSFCIAFFIGVSSAAGILLGNQLGKNDFDGAYLYAKRFIKIGIIGSLIIGGLLALSSSFYINTYKVDSEVKTVASQLILIFSMMLFVKVSNMIMGSGILRSGGQTKLTLYLDLIGGWLIGIPLGLFTAFVLKWPIYGVYFCITLEEVFRFIVGFIWVRRKIWMKNMTHDDKAVIVQ